MIFLDIIFDIPMRRALFIFISMIEISGCATRGLNQNVSAYDFSQIKSKVLANQDFVDLKKTLVTNDIALTPVFKFITHIGASSPFSNIVLEGKPQNLNNDSTSQYYQSVLQNDSYHLINNSGIGSAEYRGKGYVFYMCFDLARGGIESEGVSGSATYTYLVSKINPADYGRAMTVKSDFCDPENFSPIIYRKDSRISSVYSATKIEITLKDVNKPIYPFDKMGAVIQDMAARAYEDALTDPDMVRAIKDDLVVQGKNIGKSGYLGSSVEAARPNSNPVIDKAKLQCLDLGFTKGSDQLLDCVAKLSSSGR